MPPTAEWRGTGRGQVQQRYIFRCFNCPSEYSIGSTDGALSVELAARWAREAGWSLGKDKRWRCPFCKEVMRRIRYAKQKQRTSEASQ